MPVFFVRRRGLEPPQIAPLVPKTSAYTNFATRASGTIVTQSIFLENSGEASPRRYFLRPQRFVTQTVQVVAIFP